MPCVLIELNIVLGSEESIYNAPMQCHIGSFGIYAG